MIAGIRCRDLHSMQICPLFFLTWLQFWWQQMIFRAFTECPVILWSTGSSSIQVAQWFISGHTVMSWIQISRLRGERTVANNVTAQLPHPHPPRRHQKENDTPVMSQHYKSKLMCISRYSCFTMSSKTYTQKETLQPRESQRWRSVFR